MDVFLSWSGEKSRKAAEALRNWLPNVIQALNPYFTPHDINKGQRWSQDIAGHLNSSNFGLILVTKDNINAPWILFEAGALSKSIGLARVCPILLDLKSTDLTGPLQQFQATLFEKHEIRKLLTSINSSIETNPLPEKTLDSVFEKWWPDLEKDISIILSAEEKDKKELRSDRELLEEVLRLSRQRAYSSFSSENKLYDKLQHKPVSYDENTRMLNVWLNEHSPYPIDLDRINSGSELLDFLLQINMKNSCKAEHVKAFLDCIEQLTDRYFKKNAQGVFCPMGVNQDVEWPNT